jgi:hypothetical protein
MNVEEKYNNLLLKYISFKCFPEEEKTREICEYACKIYLWSKYSGHKK